MMEAAVARSETPLLSKSRFMSGLQCHKRLYLECYHRDLAAPFDASTENAFDVGQRVGALARDRFGGGLLVTEDHLDHDLAVVRTREALKDPGIPAIYEAAFTWEDVRVRADILVRNPDGTFDLVEVKSTLDVKPAHLWDVALQLYVLEGAGVPLRRACLMHLSRRYVYDGGDHDLAALFTCADLTDLARELGPKIVASLAAMRVPLGSDAPPAVPVGPQCDDPYPCPFYEHCHAGLPPHPVEELPEARAGLLERLAADGIYLIREIPAGYVGLSALQNRAVEAVRGGACVHEAAIRDALAAVRFPVHFLDFETFMPAVPIYSGTRPYETIPFQWSDHVLDGAGETDHREFLHDGAGDPRRAFVEELLHALGSEGSIVVYSSYEDSRLADLASTFPDLAPAIDSVRGRIFDLLPVIRRFVYDAAFHGSFSLKVVSPALLPALGYGDLAIQEGSAASLAFGEMIAPQTSPERRAELRTALLSYCGRDTEVLLELFRLLR